MKKENYLKITAIIIFFCSKTLHSQDRVSFSLHQDSRLFLIGDNHGNSRGTLNLLARIKLQGKQRKTGYFTLIPSYEQANLQNRYKRYSIDIGYTFNRINLKNLNFTKNIEVSLSVGYGKINHFSQNTYDWSSIGEIAYKFNNWLKFGIINQLTERTDLFYKYKKNEIRFSSFFGIEISPF